MTVNRDNSFLAAIVNALHAIEESLESIDRSLGDIACNTKANRGPSPRRIAQISQEIKNKIKSAEDAGDTDLAKEHLKEYLNIQRSMKYFIEEGPAA